MRQWLERAMTESSRSLRVPPVRSIQLRIWRFTTAGVMGGDVEYVSLKVRAGSEFHSLAVRGKI